MKPTFEELIQELNKQGLTLIPINQDSLSIKDEPKWKIVKLNK
jgi:hypothetical protein